MSSQTLERSRTAGPGEGYGGNWRVIVLDDNFNTFDHCAQALARHIPGVSLARGHAIAQQIDSNGQAIVWSGIKEVAEHYHSHLGSEGLTMAPLERG